MWWARRFTGKGVSLELPGHARLQSVTSRASQLTKGNLFRLKDPHHLSLLPSCKNNICIQMTLSLFSCCCKETFFPKVLSEERIIYFSLYFWVTAYYWGMSEQNSRQESGGKSHGETLFTGLLSRWCSEHFFSEAQTILQNVSRSLVFIIFLSLIPKWLPKPDMLVLYMCHMELGTPYSLIHCILTYCRPPE